MTSKADFNADEWDRVRQGPAVAGVLVIAAERGGTIRESVAIGKVYAETSKETTGTILSEIAADAPKVDAEALGGKDEFPVRGPQIISEAVDLLEAKASPNEVDAYKRFCLEVAEHAAEATKSGGFLGIGGKRISESESAAIDQVAATLGVERSASGPAPADAG